MNEIQEIKEKSISGYKIFALADISIGILFIALACLIIDTKAFFGAIALIFVIGIIITITASLLVIELIVWLICKHKNQTNEYK